MNNRDDERELRRGDEANKYHSINLNHQLDVVEAEQHQSGILSQ